MITIFNPTQGGFDMQSPADTDQKRLDHLDNIVRGMKSDGPKKSRSLVDEFNNLLKDIKQVGLVHIDK